MRAQARASRLSLQANPRRTGRQEGAATRGSAVLPTAALWACSLVDGERSTASQGGKGTYHPPRPHLATPSDGGSPTPALRPTRTTQQVIPLVVACGAVAEVDSATQLVESIMRMVLICLSMSMAMAVMRRTMMMGRRTMGGGLRVLAGAGRMMGVRSRSSVRGSLR